MGSPYDSEIIEKCFQRKISVHKLFADIPRRALDAYNAIKSTHVYRKGTLLLLEGRPPDGIYVLREGHAKLSIATHKKKSRILRIAGPGEILGLSATISKESYEVTAETLDACQADFVERQDFMRFLCQHSEVCLRVVQLLACNLRDTYEQLRLLSTSRSPAQRLARVLLQWCDEHGENDSRGIRVKIGLTQEETAQLVGVSRETVTRLLGQLKNERIISLDRSTLLILNKAALQSMVIPRIVSE